MTKESDHFLNMLRGSLMTSEQYIEHEVKLRVMQEVNDKRFQSLEDVVKHIDNKFNWIVGLFISSILLPVVLHMAGLV